MEEIYSLNKKKDIYNTCYSVVGLKGNMLYKLENQRNYNLKISNESCSVFKNESPFNAFVSKDKEFSRPYLNSKKIFKFTKLNIIPGNYYPRIYRPFLINHRYYYLRMKRLTKYSIGLPYYQINELYDRRLIIACINQLAFLTNMMTDILQTIYPSQKNLKTYGNDIKNLLVLSCIEVEAQLKGIYKANELNIKGNYNTGDYIKLKSPLQLHKYSVRFPLYPDLNIFSPFKTWNANSPSKSIKWYDNYNAVKHNSETELDKATLKSAISAICAVAVLLKAQYGPDIPLWKEEIGNFYDIEDNTKWENGDMLLPPYDDNDWKKNKLSF